MRSGNKLTSGPRLEGWALVTLPGRGELQQNSVDAALQGLSQEITLFFHNVFLILELESGCMPNKTDNTLHPPPSRSLRLCISPTALYKDVIFVCVLRL